MTKTWAQLLLVVATIALVAIYAERQRVVGRLQQELRSERWTSESLRVAVLQAAKQLKRDTVRLTRWQTRWDSARVRYLEGTLDSLRNAGVQHPETVLVEVPVQVLVTADSTILACRQALSSAIVLADTCTLRTRSLERQVLILEASQPSLFWRWMERGAIAYGSFRLGQAVRH